MRQTFGFGRLGVRAVLYVQLYRDQRQGVVFDDDDVQAVRQGGVANREICLRGECRGEEEERDHESVAHCQSLHNPSPFLEGLALITWAERPSNVRPIMESRPAPVPPVSRETSILDAAAGG